MLEVQIITVDRLDELGAIEPFEVFQTAIELGANLQAELQSRQFNNLDRRRYARTQTHL